MIFCKKKLNYNVKCGIRIGDRLNYTDTSSAFDSVGLTKVK